MSTVLRVHLGRLMDGIKCTAVSLGRSLGSGIGIQFRLLFLDRTVAEMHAKAFNETAIQNSIVISYVLAYITGDVSGDILSVAYDCWGVACPKRRCRMEDFILCAKRVTVAQSHSDRFLMNGYCHNFTF